MKAEDEILTEFIQKNFIEEVINNNHMRILISNTIEFKLYLLKYRIIEAVKILLKRR